MSSIFRPSDKNPPVNKRIFIGSVVIVAMMIISLALRELSSANSFFSKLFGGINILFFWGALCFVIWKIDLWFSNKEGLNSKHKNKYFGNLNMRYIISFAAVIILVILIIFIASVYFLSETFVGLFWLFLIIGVWIIEEVLRRRKGGEDRKSGSSPS